MVTSKGKKINYLWDTGGLFLYFADHQEAKSIMIKIQNSEVEGYIPKLVLVEFYYKTMDNLGKKIADYQILLLRESKNVFVEIDYDDISNIGKLKSQYRDLSIVDSVICGLSRKLNAKIITTDDDFGKIKRIKYKKLEY